MLPLHIQTKLGYCADDLLLLYYFCIIMSLIVFELRHRIVLMLISLQTKENIV